MLDRLYYDSKLRVQICWLFFRAKDQTQRDITGYNHDYFDNTGINTVNLATYPDRRDSRRSQMQLPRKLIAFFRYWVLSWPTTTAETVQTVLAAIIISGSRQHHSRGSEDNPIGSGDGVGHR